MKVCDESLEEVGETSIRSLGIDADGVLGDVVDGQVLHWWDLGF